MLRLLLSTALVAATILPSFAADPVPTDQNVVPVDSGRFDWSGAYVGGAGSYAYGKNAFTERGVGASSLLGDINDYIGGITLGVNHQDGNFVVGLEGDYSFGTIDSLALSTPSGYNCGTPGGCNLEVDNFATIRGRLGYAFDHGLIYATAGRAFGHAKAYFDEQLPFIGINNQAHVSGPVWGGGLEYAFTNNWTAKIEYLHVDLGRLEVPQLCFDRCYTDINFETIRLGLNYKF